MEDGGHSSATKNFGILDCTLRDGGYTNDWHFSKSAATKLLQASIENGCDYFELGFRFPKQDKSRVLGPFAFSKQSLLETISDPEQREQIKIGFMINASDYASLSFDELDELFSERGNLRSFDFVRVATRPNGVKQALQLCDALSQLGYQVMLNLMQAHSISKPQLEETIAGVKALEDKSSEGKLTHIYLADTMGSMMPHTVREKIRWMTEMTDLEIGFHAHDNLRLALANSLAAVDSGASLIDGTLTGLGRGIGNTWVELLYLVRNKSTEVKNIVQLAELGAEQFAAAKNSYLAEVSYAISGKLGVHPNYVSTILENGEKYLRQLPEVFSELTPEEKGSFSEFGADLSSIWYREEKTGTETSGEQFSADGFLLVAPGVSSETFRDDLLSFADHLNLPIGSLSSDLDFPASAVDFYFCSNPLSVLSGKLKNKFDAKIVAPFSSIPDEYVRQIGDQSQVDFGLKFDPDKIEIRENLVVAPTSRVYLYAIAFLVAHGVSDIYLAGFDGYGDSDPRNAEFMQSIRRLKEIYPDLRLVSLTPSKYDLESGQLFL